MSRTIINRDLVNWTESKILKYFEKKSYSSVSKLHSELKMSGYPYTEQDLFYSLTRLQTDKLIEPMRRNSGKHGVLGDWTITEAGKAFLKENA